EEFLCWLITNKPTTIIFEACSTSNYWKPKALQAGHDARLISAKLVSVVRQNQKTDKNDALAIVQAALLPDVTFIGGKTVEQQQLQSIKRMRELSIKQRDASQKQIVALLSELNMKVVTRRGSIIRSIEDVLEDASNGLSVECRAAIAVAKDMLSTAIKAVKSYDDCLEKSVSIHADCKKLLKLEGVG
ncbi:MAG: transposase, partial [Psychromonas sp.]|nr:transposase [Psychromonas sp.]